jgi:cyclic lactone autoinducer peptide
MKLKKPSKLFFNKIGLCLIAVSTMIVKTACLGLIGEPEPPKSLLE